MRRAAAAAKFTPKACAKKECYSGVNDAYDDANVRIHVDFEGRIGRINLIAD